MKKPAKHIAIFLFSLLVYLIITSINDVYSPNWDRWSRPWWINGIELLMSLGLTYACVFVAETWEKKRRSTTTSISNASIFKELFTVFLSVFIVVNVLGGPIMELVDNYDLHDFIVVNVISALFTLNYYFIIRGSYYIRQYIDQKLKLEKLEKDKINEELKYLKNQIHPHFLFNALNTIYFQMDESVSQAKQSVEKFSNLLRYRLYDNLEEKTSLLKELNFIRDYISFEKLRHSEQLQLMVNLPDKVPDLPIYPFLFMPLIENAFKYLGGGKTVALDLVVENEHLSLVVKNTVDPELISPSKKGGIGLANLRRRLDLLYPGQYELSHVQNGEHFTGTLKINLYEN